MENLINKWLLFLIVMLGVSIVACEKPTDPEPAQKSFVVSHTIPRTPVAEKNVLPAIETESGEEGEEGEESIENQAVPGQVEMLAADTKTANGVFHDVHQPYEAKSNLDPFMPLIQEKPDTPAETQKSDEPRRILTPLEKMSLSQMKLVAVVIGENRKIAMVEEATGKGYEIGIGTYMGQNQGQVVDIQPDRVVVREMVADFQGAVTERLQELKLHKPDSGE